MNIEEKLKEGEECDEVQDIIDICNELHAKTGYTYVAHRINDELVIERVYKDYIYDVTVKDIKLTEDSKVDSVTVTLLYTYRGRPRQRCYFELWNIPKDKIIRSVDRLHWILNLFLGSPFIYYFVVMPIYTVLKKGSFWTLVGMM